MAASCDTVHLHYHMRHDKDMFFTVNERSNETKDVSYRNTLLWCGGVSFDPLINHHGSSAP